MPTRHTGRATDSEGRLSQFMHFQPGDATRSSARRQPRPAAFRHEHHLRSGPIERLSQSPCLSRLPTPRWRGIPAAAFDLLPARRCHCFSARRLPCPTASARVHHPHNHRGVMLSAVAGRRLFQSSCLRHRPLSAYRRRAGSHRGPAGYPPMPSHLSSSYVPTPDLGQLRSLPAETSPESPLPPARGQPTSAATDPDGIFTYRTQL